MSAATPIDIPSDRHQASRIAIVIPVYNGAEYLERAIQSALNQTLPPAEIVITDDASTDATAQVIAKFQSHPLIRTQRLDARVIAPVAWNKAIRFSTAPYFVILAHDDLLHPTFLAECEKALTKSPDAGLIVTGYRVIEETDVVREDRPIRRASLIGRTTFDALFQEIVVDAGMYFCDTGSVVARSAFDKIDGFDERFKGGVYDFDFYLRLASIVPTFGIAECLADYRIHASNMSADLHRDDKGDGDVVFSKISEYTGFSTEHKRQLVQNISDFQFQHYTRAVRATQLTRGEVMEARSRVADRLNRWASSGSQYSVHVLTKPSRFASRIAWNLGASLPGIGLVRAIAKIVSRRKSRWA